MKILTTAVAFSLLLSLGAGCSTAVTPPGSSKLNLDAAGWLKKAPDLAGFKRINGLLINSTNISVQRQIATDNGNTNYVVTINYTDLDALKTFDRGATLSNVLDLSSSILKLAPDMSSPDSATNLVQLEDLFKSLPLTSVVKIPSALEKATDLELAQIETIQQVQAFLALLQKFQSFQSTEFQSLLAEHIQQLLEDQLSTIAIKQTNSLTINVSLDAVMAAYLSAYLNGNFVDRWGTTLSQPDMSKLGNDTAVTAAKVALEAVFDYAMMTPIVHDSSQSSTNKTPTFAVIFPQLYEDISANPDAPGITAPENEAIKYLSGLSGDEAKHVSALIVKSLGGASVGVKVSTGDNSTFSQIISTFCEEFFRRNTEEFSYDLFEKFQYRPTTNNSPLGYEPNKTVNDQQLAGLKNLYILDKPFQTAVVAALVSQDELKALSQGGWKLSGSNITNYQALATKLLSTNDLAKQVFSQLDPSIQGFLKSGTPLNSTQQQSLTDSLNQLAQAGHPLFTTDQLSGVSLSPDTAAVLCQPSDSSPLQHFQHLNTLLLLDVFGRDSVGQ